MSTQTGLRKTYIGRVPDFDKSERFDLYIERFERMLAANEVPEGKKADILLMTLPASANELLRDLLSPRTTTECSYGDLKDALIQPFKPNAITIAERFRFYKRNQEEGETLSDFVAALKKLAPTYDFRAQGKSYTPHAFEAMLRNIFLGDY